MQKVMSILVFSCLLLGGCAADGQDGLDPDLYQPGKADLADTPALPPAPAHPFSFELETNNQAIKQRADDSFEVWAGYGMDAFTLTLRYERAGKVETFTHSAWANYTEPTLGALGRALEQAGFQVAQTVEPSTSPDDPRDRYIFTLTRLDACEET